jgi:Sigma-70, region 4
MGRGTTHPAMTQLDRLPPDQRAVLSLVLDRGKSYAEVAELLAIPEQTVRDRAHAALDALTNDAARPAERRAPVPPRDPTSPAERGAPPRAAGGAGTGDTSRATRADGTSASKGSLPPRADARGSLGAPSSRRGGALLLAAIVVVVVVVVILVSGGGGKGKSSASTTAASTNSSSTSTTSAGKPSLNKTIALSPLDPELKAAGTAYVLSQSRQRAFYVAARGLPPSTGFFYAVWLYNSPSSSAPLGRGPGVDSDGRMEGGGPLPTNAGFYHQLIITKETSTHPHHPGQIVLRGTFALH